GWLFTGFPWLYLGNSFTDTWLVGWAPIGGVLLLSLIGAATGVILLLLFSAIRLRHKISATVVAVVLRLCGIKLDTIDWTQHATDPLSLTMVLPALNPGEKLNSDILYDILMQLRLESLCHWNSDL